MNDTRTTEESIGDRKYRKDEVEAALADLRSEER